MNLNHHMKLTVSILFLLTLVFFSHAAYALTVTIVTSTGKTVVMDAKPEETIGDVKDFVFDVTGIHQGTQRIYRGTELLQDTRTLTSYNIADGDTLTLRMGAGNVDTEGGDSGGGSFTVIIVIVIIGILVFAAFKLFSGKKPTG